MFKIRLLSPATLVLDPEVNTGGNYKGGKAEYPQTRTFSLGAKLSF